MFEDRWLLWKCKNGSSEALTRLYEKYESYLITVATALLNNTHAAEDVLHDVMILFVNSVDQIKLQGNLKAYLATCVTNVARNKIKRNKLESNAYQQGESNTSIEFKPDLLAMQAEQTERLNRLISQLPYEQKETIVLHLHAHMQFTQIAQARNTSVNTIRSRYRYGLEKLRSLVNSEVDL